MFMNLFHSSGVEHSNERAWILKLLVNGLKDSNAYYMYKKNQVFDLAMSCYNSVICDKKSKVSYLHNCVSVIYSLCFYFISSQFGWWYSFRFWNVSI